MLRALWIIVSSRFWGQKKYQFQNKSRPSSYSGSKHNISRQSSRVKKFTNFDAIITSPKVSLKNLPSGIQEIKDQPENENSEFSLSNSVKNLAAQITKEIFSIAAERLAAQSNEQESECDVKEDDYNSQRSMIREYLFGVYSASYNRLLKEELNKSNEIAAELQNTVNEVPIPLVDSASSEDRESDDWESETKEKSVSSSKSDKQITNQNMNGQSIYNRIKPENSTLHQDYKIINVNLENIEGQSKWYINLL